MNKAFEKISHQLTGTDSLEKADESGLAQLTKEHPYFSPAQFLLAVRLRMKNNEKQYSVQFNKASLYSSNPIWLQYQLNDLTDEVAKEVKDSVITEPDKTSSTEEIAKAITGENVVTIQPISGESVPAQPPVLIENKLDVTANEPDSFHNVVSLSENYEEPYEEEIEEEESSAFNTDSFITSRISSILDHQMADFNKPVKSDAKLDFEAEPSHTVDYFASQGIKLDLTQQTQDKLTAHLRSFTGWLRQMRKIEATISPENDEVIDEEIENAVNDIAKSSIESREIVTETMADIFIKQGKPDKAVQLYIKLSFLDPDKSTYFANKIQQLKGI
jgi:hypothetical protein